MKKKKKEKAQLVAKEGDEVVLLAETMGDLTGVTFQEIGTFWAGGLEYRTVKILSLDSIESAEDELDDDTKL